MYNIKRNTKIVCTIGPASDNKETLIKLIKAGMSCMRINFSHGEYPEHQKKIDLLREIEKEENICVPIMLDTKGPEIRTHEFKDGKATIKDKSIVRICMHEVLGDETKFSVTFDKLYDDLNVGNIVKLDDGKLELEIIDKDKENKELVCKALNTHTIKNRRGVNIPGIHLSLPFISEKDKNDLIFGCKNDVDFISASFIRSPEDVRKIREILVENNKPGIKIISKIENQEALTCLDEIIKESDGIMIARGDLGVEIPAEDVPIIQRKLIKKCRELGKPVITATQMLDSMTFNPNPTRAEVSDVATAVTESSDCVMLSGESANGLYPIEACSMQAKIAGKMEKYLDYEKLAVEAYDSSNKDNNDAIANSIANTALLIGAKLIVCFTETGRTAIRISKARPCCPIVAVTNNKKTAESLGLYWGVFSSYIPTTVMPDFIEEMEVIALMNAIKYKIPSKSTVIVAGGTPTGSGNTNFMRIVYVPEIRDV
ncbi:MAG: pyruvate kinase [Firmicutes bacterium]|nr:pyruvate kinase [Candidatus Alectryobacillus merdavium]